MFVCSTFLSMTDISETEAMSIRAIVAEGVNFDIVAAGMADTFDVDANSINFVAFLEAPEALAAVLVKSAFSGDAFVTNTSFFFATIVVSFASDFFTFIVLADLFFTLTMPVFRASLEGADIFHATFSIATVVMSSAINIFALILCFVAKLLGPAMIVRATGDFSTFRKAVLSSFFRITVGKTLGWEKVDSVRVRKGSEAMIMVGALSIFAFVVVASLFGAAVSRSDALLDLAGVVNA